MKTENPERVLNLLGKFVEAWSLGKAPNNSELAEAREIVFGNRGLWPQLGTQKAMTKSKAELAKQAFLFREGAKRLFEDESKSTNGDMWFFELYHFLHDVQDKLQELDVSNYLSDRVFNGTRPLSATHVAALRKIIAKAETPAALEAAAKYEGRGSPVATSQSNGS